VDLVDTAKLRWRIERDHQELKQEVGLGHYEERGWRGFHHHATLCIAAYGFLISEREAFPPSGPRTALHGARAARSLSYEGVEYELVEHALTSEQTRVYDAYAGARSPSWTIRQPRPLDRSATCPTPSPPCAAG
jgi:hypothetical protein